MKRNVKRLQAKIRNEELRVFSRGYNHDKNSSRGGTSTRSSAVGSSSDSKHNSTNSANASLQSPSQPITDDESEEASETMIFRQIRTLLVLALAMAMAMASVLIANPLLQVAIGSCIKVTSGIGIWNNPLPRRLLQRRV